MPAIQKDTEDFKLRISSDLRKNLDDLAEKVQYRGGNQLAVVLIEDSFDWLQNPDPLADPPHELRKLRRKLHGVSTERVQPLLREEPAAYPALSDNLMRAYESALAAKDQTISLLEQEVVRLKSGGTKDGL